MLSRRRRVSSCSIQPAGLDDDLVSRNFVETDVPRLRTFTEDSTFASVESFMRETGSGDLTVRSGHVDNRGNLNEDSDCVDGIGYDARRPSLPSGNVPGDRLDEKLRCHGCGNPTSLIRLNQQQQQQQQPQQQPQQHNPDVASSRPCENSRRRRRKNMRILDSPSIVQNSTYSPTTFQTQVNSETRLGTSEEPPRIFESDVNDQLPIGSDLPKTSNDDPRGTDCRTNVPESRETRPRLKNHEIQDFVHENKNFRIRESIACHGSPEFSRITGNNRRTSWTRLSNSKFRYPLLLGLLIWTIMTMPEVSGRQSHHRTCPGCPHQHVQTVNRKAFPMDDEPSDEADPAPSPDDLRLEAIKVQILTKLGLRARPDVNKTLVTVPRHLALETLYRTEAQPVAHHGYSDGHHESRRREHNRRRGNSNDRYSSSSSSSSSSHSSSDSADGKYHYDGEEYSYRTVDPDLEENLPERGNDDGESVMDDFYARTSEIITFAEPGCTLNGQPLLEFPRSAGDPALEPLRIKKATLWARVELRHPHHYQPHRRSQGYLQNITLWVFRVSCGNVTHLRGKDLGQHLDLVTSLSVNVNQLGWQKFDVTKVVNEWYSGHKTALTRHEKLTLLVDCTGCGLHVHVSTFGAQTPNVVESSANAKGEQDPDRPFLVVRTDPKAVKRVKRMAIECSGAVKGQCCKQRFYVNFSQLGWDDWIIAPQGYYANYCRGDCAARHRTPDTFLNYYTHVIEEYRKMDRLAGMQPCCAPVKFSPMSLIYYGPDSNIIKRDLPKMVVDECGCP